MRESSIERSCRRYAIKRGCWPIKLQGGITGDPDRGFVLPGHYFWPVEFKATNGRRSPRQKQRHLELEAMGFHVTVIDDTKLFRAMLDMLLQATAE